MCNAKEIVMILDFDFAYSQIHSYLTIWNVRYRLDLVAKMLHILWIIIVNDISKAHYNV